MKLSRDEEIRLERWLNHRLDHESNAETLSRYVLSLLKEERGDNRQFVQDELRTFLKDNTTQFVDSLFSALKDGSYKGVQMESEETGDDQLERRNSMDGRRERSGSDDSRSRGRLRRRYSDDAADRERDYRDRDREERDRSRSRDRHSGRDKERDRGGDNFRDRNKGSGDRWKDRSGNYRNNSNNNNRGGYQTFRKNDQSNKTEHYPQPVEQPMPWMQGGFMPPQMNAPYPNPYPWNPAAPPPGSAPYYPPPFNPYGMPYPPPAYPPYNPFGPPPDASNNQPMYNPNQFHPQPVTTPTTTENPTAPSNADEMEEVKPENADTITVTPQKAETESTEISSKDENKASYEDELYAQNTPISPPVYPPPMWNYDANYMMYGQGYGNNNNSNNNAGSNNNINKNNRGFNNDNNNNNRRRNNNNNSNNNNNNNKTQLPENERCTIRCTGIPTSIKEEDIRAHFECFGSIVKLEISPMEDHNNNNNNNNNQDSLDGNEKDKKKTYNECLVQFYSAANAKKCLTSQAPVLSNRFIRLHASSFNIIMPSDVDPPSYDMIENDKALLTQDIQPQPYDPHKKKATLASTHKIGVTNKWRRPDPKTAVNSEESGNGVENPNTLTTTSTDNEGSSSAAQVAAKKENEELKQEFEQLKTLKQQAEDILKQKEKVLLESVEKCRAMLEKLESAEENEKKTSFLQNLENKIVDLQAQLRTVREQMEKGVASADSYNKPYPGFRGGPSGRMPYYGGRAAAYARGGFAPTGRGRGYGRQNKYVNANAAPIAGANNFFGGGNPFLQQSQATGSSVTNSSVEESETTEM